MYRALSMLATSSLCSDVPMSFSTSGVASERTRKRTTSTESPHVVSDAANATRHAEGPTRSAYYYCYYYYHYYYHYY